MNKYVIQGGRPLQGVVRITGAKNSILPILAAVLLSQDNIIVHDCPRLMDVENMILILQAIGCHIKREEHSLLIDPSSANNWIIPDQYVKEIRSSIVLLGAVLARMQKAKITYPGGCEIGQRPINLHLKGLRQLGVIIDESNGYLECEASQMVGTDIHLDYPSVGATENIMLAACRAKGQTIIRNAAREPEIADLQNFINSMGGHIRGAGSNTIIIEGMDCFRGTEYRVIPDRIITATFMLAAAITGGDVLINNIVFEHVQAIVSKLKEAGCIIYSQGDSLRIKGKRRLLSIEHTKTLPYPGFPTDIQAPFMSVMCIAEGTSIISETIFENRYKHVPELIRMGANIRIDGQTAIIQGVKEFTGTEVIARDLRGGAALVLAGLRAYGQTTIHNIHHVDRGYENFEGCLRDLGAEIKRI
jgi:UDP-N-acetylglucosamine 1-carboxyvinyltransferase